MPYDPGPRDAHLGGRGRNADGRDKEPRLRVYTLGRFEVRAGRGLVIDESWSRSKAKAILKLLAVEGRSLHRDQVIEVLWPESHAGAGGNSLRQSLHHLRSAFRADGLTSPVNTDDDSLSLCADVWTDVAAFRSAAQAARASRKDILLYENAVDLYGGDLLPRDVYEDWIEYPRDELKALHMRLLSELADLCQSDGHCETAEELLLRVLRADPVREEEHRRLMRVYIHCGRRAEAARQYEVCRDILKRELGVDPSAETEALYREIVNGDAEARAAAAPAADTRSDIRYPDPEIRHARTLDGLRIAYSTYGEGEPLVLIPTTPSSHLLVEWEMPGLRHFYELLAQGRRIIRYDTRGTGVTGGDISEYTLDGLVSDLEAVVDDLGLERFPLYGSFNAGPVAIAYTARHPERVSRLFLWSCYARGADFFDQSPIAALGSLPDRDWEQYCQAMGNALNGWVAGDSANQLVNHIRMSSPPEIVRAFIRDGRNFDASKLIPLIRCPTLVVHRRDEPILGEIVKRLAADIPGSRLLFVDRTAAVPWTEKVEEVVGIIDGFVREKPTLPGSEKRRSREAEPASRDAHTSRRASAPPTRYATTTDGVSIAYCTSGGGPPLVMMPAMPHTHLQLEWGMPEARSFYEEIGSRHTLLRYDGRGTGLSDRKVRNYSLEAVVRDLEAVVEAAGLQTFALFASFHSGPAAIRFAATHPDEVTHLLLWCTYASGADFMALPSSEGMRALLLSDWSVYAETAARYFMGWGNADASQRFAPILKESVLPEDAVAFVDAIPGHDATHFLSKVRSPVLVLHRQQLAWMDTAFSTALAAGIPGARLTLLSGDASPPFAGDSEEVIATIDEFLEDAPSKIDRRRAGRDHAPPIRHAPTSDGVSIAYWTLGEGPPLVVMPRIPFSHLEHEWKIGEWRDWYERLAESRTVIRYDPRGAGCSQRSVHEYSLDSLALDLDGVADALGVDRFDLFGFGHSSPVAVAYAAEKPERVRRLALWCPYASGREFWQSSRTRAFQALRRRDWVLYTETAARALYGWAEGEAPRRCAAMMRESMDEEMAGTAFAAIRRFDVRRYLSRVTAPTLVMVREGLPETEVVESRRLAAEVAGARLCVLNGPEAVPFLGDTEAVVSVLEQFLDEAAP